jgi:PBP1b-binding outer membrane lipoprotein LpoB
MRKSSQDIPFLLEIQADHKDITKIREQQQLVNKIQSTISKKDQ